MARKASSKPADSTANLGFEAQMPPFGIPHSGFVISPWVQHFIHNLAPYTALRGSAFLQSEASPQVLSAAKDNGRIYGPASGSGGSLPAFRKLRRARFAVKDCAIAPGGVQTERFVEVHDGTAQSGRESFESKATLWGQSAVKGNRANISIYGQDKRARRQCLFGFASSKTL